MLNFGNKPYSNDYYYKTGNNDGSYSGGGNFGNNDNSYGGGGNFGNNNGYSGGGNFGNNNNSYGGGGDFNNNNSGYSCFFVSIVIYILCLEIDRQQKS